MRAKRTILIALLGLLSVAVGACASTASSSARTAPTTSGGQTTIRLGLVQGQDFTHAMPAQVGAAQGIFAKHGLNVQIVDFSAGSDLVKAIAGGTIDVGEATGLDVVSAAANGIDLKAFYGTAAKTPMSVIVKAGSPIHSLADLKGKPVGISKFGSLTDFTVKLIEQKTGLSADAIKEVPLGAPSANMAALRKGDVAGIVLPVEFAANLAAAGTQATALRVSDLTTDSQFAILAASSGYLKANADAVKRLVAAYAEAIRYIQANQDGTVSLAESKLGMKPAVATQTYQELAPDFTPTGSIDVAGMQQYADQLPALKIAQQVPAQSTWYDPGFTPVG